MYIIPLYQVIRLKIIKIISADQISVWLLWILKMGIGQKKKKRKKHSIYDISCRIYKILHGHSGDIRPLNNFFSLKEVLATESLVCNILSKFWVRAPPTVVKFSEAAHTNSSHRLQLGALQHQDAVDTIIRGASKTKLNCLKKC